MAEGLPVSGKSVTDERIQVVGDEPAVFVDGVRVQGDYSTAAQQGERWKGAIEGLSDGQIVSCNSLTATTTATVASSANSIKVMPAKSTFTNLGLTNERPLNILGNDASILGDGATTFNGGGDQTLGTPAPLFRQYGVAMQGGGRLTCKGIKVVETIQLADEPSVGIFINASGGVAEVTSCHVVDGGHNLLEVRGGGSAYINNHRSEVTKPVAWNVARAINFGTGNFDTVKILNPHSSTPVGLFQSFQGLEGNPGVGNTCRNLTVDGMIHDVPDAWDATLGQAGSYALVKANECSNVNFLNSVIKHNIYSMEVQSLTFGGDGTTEETINGSKVHIEHCVLDSGFWKSGADLGSLTFQDCKIGEASYGFRDGVGAPITNAAIQTPLRHIGGVRNEITLDNCQVSNVLLRLMNTDSVTSGYPTQTIRLKNGCKIIGNYVTTPGNLTVLADDIRDCGHFHVDKDTVLATVTGRIAYSDSPAKNLMMSCRDANSRRYDAALTGDNDLEDFPFAGVVGVDSHEIINQSGADNRWFWARGTTDWNAST